MEQFIVIITCVNKHGDLNSNAVLCESFNEALNFAREDAEYYKHLASIYVEKIGSNHLHAEIIMRGQYINKKYRISNIKCDKKGELSKRLVNKPNTYVSCDYIDGVVLF